MNEEFIKYYQDIISFYEKYVNRLKIFKDITTFKNSSNANEIFILEINENLYLKLIEFRPSFLKVKLIWLNKSRESISLEEALSFADNKIKEIILFNILLFK